MDTAECRETGAKPEVGLLFIILVGMSVALSGFLPKGVLEFWRQLLLAVTSLIGAVLGLGVTVRGEIMSVNGFAMRIADECTAVNYVIILCIAIALYSRHSVRYRIAGMFLAVPAIVLLNAFRLIVTGTCGTISPELFTFMHEYLWVALFAMCIFVLWKVWVDRIFHFTWRAVRYAGGMVVTCTGGFLLLYALLPIAAPGMASLSSLLLGVVLPDPQSGIVWAGDRMECLHAGVLHHVPLTVEYFNVAVFGALVVPLQKKRDWRTLGLTLFSLPAIVLLDAALVANAMWITIRWGSPDATLFLFLEKGLVLALPFGLWWVISTGTCAGEGRGVPRSGASVADHGEAA